MSKFDRLPVRDNARGNFVLDKEHITTSDFFRWDVVHMVSCVQHDVASLNIHSFIDAAPNPFPVNGSINVGLYSFFCPNRLVWKDWKNYITDLESGLTPPYFTIKDLWDVFHDPALVVPWRENYSNDSIRFLSNVLGLSAIMHWMQESSEPPAEWASLKLSALPLRALNRAWFDWLRDKAHISDMALESYCKDTGGHITVAELVQLCAPKYRCYKKNYITTAFDKPSEDIVSSPLSQIEGGIVATDKASGIGQGDVNFVDNAGLDVDSRSSVPRFRSTTESLQDQEAYFGVNVADLRLSTSRQNYAERILIAGKTVLSRALALFGVAPTIEELQMTNYLGGHEEKMLFKTSASGSSTVLDSDRPHDNSAGSFGYDPNKATVAGQKFQNMTSPDNGFGLENVTYKTDESGFLFVLSCITPVVNYYQGLPRDWFRGLDTFASDKFDYFHSDLENQGLQPVLNYEVLCARDISPKGVFGFQQQYIDYKFSMDSLGGDFIIKSSKEAMSKMHLGRDIDKILTNLAEGGPSQELLTPTVLTQATGEDMAYYDKLFTIESPAQDHFICNHRIACNMNRPMQENSLPSLDAELSRISSKRLVENGGFRL